MFCFKEKGIKPKKFDFPKEFINFLNENKFEKMSLLWVNLFRDTLLFIRYYDFLLEKFPKEKYIPFALAIDESGVFNDGFAIIACFVTDDRAKNKIFIYDCNKEYLHLKNKNDFSFFLTDFLEWEKIANKYLHEYLKHRIIDE